MFWFVPRKDDITQVSSAWSIVAVTSSPVKFNDMVMRQSSNRYTVNRHTTPKQKFRVSLR